MNNIIQTITITILMCFATNFLYAEYTISLQEYIAPNGVAPQCAIPGLTFGSAGSNSEGIEAYGRIEFRGDPQKKNFVDIHLGENYEWVIDIIDNGRVKQRD